MAGDLSLNLIPAYGSAKDFVLNLAKHFSGSFKPDHHKFCKTRPRIYNGFTLKVLAVQTTCFNKLSTWKKISVYFFKNQTSKSALPIENPVENPVGFAHLLTRQSGQPTERLTAYSFRCKTIHTANAGSHEAGMWKVQHPPQSRFCTRLWKNAQALDFKNQAMGISGG